MHWPFFKKQKRRKMSSGVLQKYPPYGGQKRESKPWRTTRRKRRVVGRKIPDRRSQIRELQRSEWVTFGQNGVRLGLLQKYQKGNKTVGLKRATFGQFQYSKNFSKYLKRGSQNCIKVEDKRQKMGLGQFQRTRGFGAKCPPVHIPKSKDTMSKRATKCKREAFRQSTPTKKIEPARKKFCPKRTSHVWQTQG